jgi:hypothetical protein
MTKKLRKAHFFVLIRSEKSGESKNKFPRLPGCPFLMPDRIKKPVVFAAGWIGEMMKTTPASSALLVLPGFLFALAPAGAILAAALGFAFFAAQRAFGEQGQQQNDTNANQDGHDVA